MSEGVTVQEQSPLDAKLWNAKGELQRPQTIFRNFISREAGARFPPAVDRYHLYVSYACPWAHRTLIVRKLKGLENIITFTALHYLMSITTSWRFVTADEKLPGENVTLDPLHPEFKLLKELYLKADPNYPGRFSVPILWDKKTETIVSNESSEIIRMFYTEFDDLLPEKYRNIVLYPENLRKEIDMANEWMYEFINNGVYKSGVAKTQEAYKTAVNNLFSHLDKAEAHLSSPSHTGPYYYGSSITEVDVRLYVTLIRFDAVYVSIFKTNKRMIRYGYPALNKWMKNLYWNVNAFKETTDFKHIKSHYFGSLTFLNPSGIVPEGPVPDIESLG